MRTARMVLSGIFLIFLYSPAAAGDGLLGDLRLSLIEGDVQIRTDDTGDWVAASGNFPLLEGDRIWVPEEGRAEIHDSNGSFIRLDESSSLDLVSVGRDASQLYLSSGRAYLNFIARGGSVLQVDTPGAMARAHDPAKFMVRVDRYGNTEISVFRGVVLVDTREGRVRVPAGRKLTVSDDRNGISRLSHSDAWELGNMERDRLYADRGRGEYLPEELREYGSEFEENGRWVYAPDYGYVWTPTVQVSVGWSPYRHGRWIWRGGDYVWVSYERWGWVPYHYGRWSFVLNIGWCWVPPARGAVYWGPGYVGWVSTPTYVAWVPLAPGEIYYGRGYYGPHSVNITNINVNTTVVNVYRNVHAHNAVTVVHRDTFVSGRHADVHVKGNPFLTEKIHAGRPEIRPEKTTAAPVIRDVPEHKRPPRFVREEHPPKIRETRRLVKERSAPVVRPEVFERSKNRQQARNPETPQKREQMSGRQPEHPLTAERETRGGEGKGHDVARQKDPGPKQSGLGGMFQGEARPVPPQGSSPEKGRLGQEREQGMNRERVPQGEKGKTGPDNKARATKEARWQDLQKERGMQRGEEARPVPPLSTQHGRGDTEKRDPREQGRVNGSVMTGPEPAAQRSLSSQPRASGRDREDRSAKTKAPAESRPRSPKVEQAIQRPERLPDQQSGPQARNRQGEQAPKASDRGADAATSEPRAKVFTRDREQPDEEQRTRGKDPAEGQKSLQPVERKDKGDAQESSAVKPMEKMRREERARGQERPSQETKAEVEQGRRDR